MAHPFTVTTRQPAGFAITVVAGGYGGDMPESQFEELLDDMDFYHNRVQCRKTEQLLPTLNKLVEQELQLLEKTH